MGSSTEITWCDATFNPWFGCVEVSPGCTACYARTFTRRIGHSETGSKLPLWGVDAAHVWRQMIARCHDPSNAAFDRYGGRGIVVCDRWRESFAAFLEDMGARPSRHTVERVDNDRGYGPENCIWATQAVQGRNTRQNVRITFQGETLVLKDWAARVGLSALRLGERLRNGWSVERALTEPLGAFGPPKGTDVNAARRLRGGRA